MSTEPLLEVELEMAFLVREDIVDCGGGEFRPVDGETTGDQYLILPAAGTCRSVVGM